VRAVLAVARRAEEAPEPAPEPAAQEVPV
jgi:hypothetical protein